MKFKTGAAGPDEGSCFTVGLVFLSECDGPGLFVRSLLTGADGKMRGLQRWIPQRKVKKNKKKKK